MTILDTVYRWVGDLLNVSPRDAEFWRGYTGGDNYAGKSVTQQSALQLSTVWSCVRLLAETIATLPLTLYSIGRDGKPRVAYGDMLYTVLHDMPNAEMTAVDFWESMLASMLLWGNCYARVERMGEDSVVALVPLRPERMSLDRDRETGDLVYRYSDPTGRVDYAPEEIFHVKGFSLDGLRGLSVIQFARHSMGAAMAIEEAAATTFARGMRPGGVMSMTQILTKEQREIAEKNLIEKFTGSMNAGRTMLLEGGAKYEQVTMNPEDAQMLESRAFSVEELCRWFRVPPFMVGYTEKTTSWGTGLEQQNIGFLTYSLRPYLKRIEQQITRSLIPPRLRATRFAEYQLEGLLRADSEGRSKLYSSFAQNGVMTRNEIRAKENLPASEDANANKLTVQSNLLPIDKLGEKAPTATPPANDATTEAAA